MVKLSKEQMGNKCFLGLILGFLGGHNLCAAFETVRVMAYLDKSKTLVLNRGVFEGVREGDFALLYYREEGNEPVAKIEAIETGDKSSKWIAIESKRPELLGEGKIFTMTKVPTLGVFPQTKGMKVIKSSKAKALFKNEGEYHEISVLPPTAPFKKRGQRKVNKAQWAEVIKGPPKVYQVEDTETELEQEEELKDDELADFYSQSWKLKGKKHASKLNSKNKRDARWSTHMDDEQLHQHFIKQGVAWELHRQKIAIEKWSQQELGLRYSTGIVRDKYKSLRSDVALSIGYGFNLGYFFAEYGQNFSTEVAMSVGLSSISPPKHELISQEYLFNWFFYWYFYHSPGELKAYLPFLGIGFMRGHGRVGNSHYLKDDYSYQLQGFPALRGGFKYRFLDGSHSLDFNFGINVLFTISNVTYTALRVEEGLPPSINKGTSSMAVGFDIYF